jgi:hypothetical protein
MGERYLDELTWDQTEATYGANDFTMISRDQSNLKLSPDVSPQAQKTISSHQSLFSNVRSLASKENSSAKKLS